jgi:RNA polymerase sigma-70 factor (ECF subfamily)
MTPDKTLDDAELLRLMRAGDEEAFTALYGRRQGGVYRFALHMSGSAAVAEDVTQEVFLALIREAGGYDSTRGSVAAYLYGIARNHVLRRLERERCFVPMPETAEGGGGQTPEPMVSEADPLGDLTRSEAIEAVRQAVLALPAHYREVVVLCELHEMSYADAALSLDCAVGTVRSRLHRARALLVEKLRAVRETDTASEKIGLTRCFA